MDTAQKIQRRGTTSKRILAPDVARGLALLGIAVANLPTAWAIPIDAEGDSMLGGFYPGASETHHLLDQLAMVFSAMFAHVRGLPMFATLLGFGIGLISLSLQRRQFPRNKAMLVLVRRYGFLALFGVIHCIFLFFGDIMILYGLLAMIVALMIGLSNKAIKWIAGVLLGLGVTVGTAFTFFMMNSFGDKMINYSFTLPENYLGYMLLGLGSIAGYVFGVVASAGTIFPVILIGFLFARTGVLHEPEKHLRTLWAWIIAGAAVVLFIGLPWGLSAAGFINPEWAETFSTLNLNFGYITGPAIVALVTVVLMPVQRRYAETDVVPLWLRAPVALGKRSMSGYLMQSVLFFILALPFTLNLLTDIGAALVLVVATGVWLVTLILAVILEMTGTPGPFEWLHRRISYGKNGLPTQWKPPQAELPAHPIPAQQPPHNPAHNPANRQAPPQLD
ncbi:DUF418 domain-containing protein [Corynebacterium breve]|uniref:DUF418 domain-containing protein n=1 Tax=Corynebacterium breve TaxID=3049799 RepID=A0ABY8VCD2_9CORY|nr:DUF418 domain-containing protein [Corynebacterium breve]WIM66757.1 DUF418 domain-containing protein [Corynebacterium breve]